MQTHTHAQTNCNENINPERNGITKTQLIQRRHDKAHVDLDLFNQD